MKRCALIVADNPSLREWLGCHVTSRWPGLLLEYSRLGNAPMYLDRAELSRYQILIIRLGKRSFAEMTTCIFLLRILNLKARPNIVLIAEDAEQLNAIRSTRLRECTCLLAGELTSSAMRGALSDIECNRREAFRDPYDGSPDIPGYAVRRAVAGTYSATVYVAYSHERREEVALKIRNLHDTAPGNVHQLSLRQEYETMRRLAGAQVARVFDYGETGDLAYLAMEYLRHGNIEDLFARRDPRNSRTRCLLQVADALRQIHNAGILHLDLKPNNVLIRSDGTPVLIDFGISKRTAAARYRPDRSSSIGSPYFMSPEQARGEPLDVRSDIYSFGALWYRIFTGGVPFAGATVDAIAAARDRGGPPRLPKALSRYQVIVDKTLAAHRENRFSTARELMNAIQYYGRHSSAPDMKVPCRNSSSVA